MYTSTYVPVNMHRLNCAVYSNEKVFPEKKLLKAYEKVSGNGDGAGVVYSNGVVSFMDEPNVYWSLPEIYLAYNAYQQALKNNFSFYTATNKLGVPQLYISKAFKGCRILIDAYSMKSILLQNPQLVAKATSLIDKKLTNIETVDIFKAMSAIENGSGKFLPGLIVGRDSDDEFMVVSPIMTPWTENMAIYGMDYVAEIEELLATGQDQVGSAIRSEAGILYENMLNSLPPMPYDVANYIVSLAGKIKEKKSNYVELQDEDYVVHLYFSTNQRYLVNAQTFECVVIKNQHIKSLLTHYASQNNTPRDQLHMAWALAKTE